MTAEPLTNLAGTAIYASWLSTDSPPSWRQEAACRDSDPSLFYPTLDRTSYDQYAQARLICEACTVVAECLEDAVEHESAESLTFGFRAGMSARGRTMYRQNKRRSVA